MKKINWKFKKNAKPQGSSNGFWYDLTSGGYIKPEEVLSDKTQISLIRNTVEVLKSFENALKDNELLDEF